MDRDLSADHGSGAEGEAARNRLMALLADSAVLHAVAGLMDGTDSDAPGTRIEHSTPGDGASTETAQHRAPFLSRVCTLAVSEVGVSGAGVTVMGSVAEGIAGRRDQVACGGAASRRLEDLQLTVGQGPCLDAFASGAPVLVGDLEADAARWPGFAPEALALGVMAVFSLPLQIGAVRLGTLDLYRDTVGPLKSGQLDAALLLAGLVTENLLEHAEGAEPEDAGWLADVHAEVHQASGMVSVAEHIGVGDALVRIRGYAYAQGRPITEVAERIIARDLVLSDIDPDPDP